MKVLGVIPARYASGRMPGKPLADICGKPMIWWVYQAAIKSKDLSTLLLLQMTRGYIKNAKSGISM